MLPMPPDVCSRQIPTHPPSANRRTRVRTVSCVPVSQLQRPVDAVVIHWSHFHNCIGDRRAVFNLRSRHRMLHATKTESSWQTRASQVHSWRESTPLARARVSEGWCERGEGGAVADATMRAAAITCGLTTSSGGDPTPAVPSTG